MSALRCKKHPTYQVKRAPRSDCHACWIMWLKKTCQVLKRAEEDRREREQEERRYWI
jgi:hypothetical protein